jgi:hypothetical protein
MSNKSNPHPLLPSSFEEYAKNLWNSRVTKWLLGLAALVGIIWLIVQPQSPGIAIALSGIAATIMGFREGYRERLLWLVFAGAFLGVELHAIHVADKENRREQNETARRFQAIAKDLQTSIKTSKKGFDTTLKQSQTINHLASENLRQLTSAGTYCYVEFVRNDRQANKRLLMVNVIGKYPIYELGVTFYDPALNQTSSMANLNPNVLFFEQFGTRSGGRGYFWRWVDLPNETHKQYEAAINSRSAIWAETIDLIKDHDGWHEGLQLRISSADVHENNKLVFETFDKPFTDQENIKWKFQNGRWTKQI